MERIISLVVYSFIYLFFNLFLIYFNFFLIYFLIFSIKNIELVKILNF
jgi:hypothetical protein